MELIQVFQRKMPNGRVRLCAEARYDSERLAGQVDEVDAFEVAAVVMNIVFPALLAVGGNVHAAGKLILDRLPRGLDQQLFRYLPGVVIGVGEGAREIRALLLGFGEVTDLDIVRFRVSADTGRGYFHARMISDGGKQIKVKNAQPGW